MNKIDPKRLAEELQKAKFKGKPASEVLKELRQEADANAVQPKKENALVDAGTARANDGTPVEQGFLGKAKSFTEAMVSRGLNDKKASPETISLRVLSCHGNPDKNLPPCPKRMDSNKFANSHYCGACGCGDKQLTQLTPFENGGKMVEYTKLHYPKVTCPLEMPGFTNYKSNAESAKTANDRKQFIEFNESVDYIKSKSNP
jgi:hypothetical protein